MQRKWRRAWQRQVNRVSKQKVVQNFLSPLLAAGILLGSITGVSANPAGGQVTVGSGSIAQNGNVMTVTQNTNKLGINWQSFNIQAGEKVNFVQPNSQSVALNRVIGNEGSKIYGQLSANGQVFLINPNGVLFAPGAQVNVGGLVASTQNLTDSNFQAGNYKFSGNGGVVVNQGTITAANGGYVALLGNQVSNQGIIVAKQGTVTLGAGNATTLDFNGDGLLSLTVSQPAIQALAENKNLIQADGGQVMMTARAADALAGTVVNNTGRIQARSIETKNGVITLDGGPAGTVSVSGTLDATGNESGQIGGTVKVLGSNITVQNATLSVSGDQGGGTVLVGGNFHGQGPEYNATTTTIGQNAVIQADALTHGDGGKVVVWSNDSTTFGGTITAKGGTESGNGGSVETSGHTLKVSGRVDTRAAKGATGNWLLDPYDFNIGVGGDISASELKGNLESSNMTITTTLTGSSLNNNVGSTIANGAPGTNKGDIYVNEPVAWDSSKTLTLSAYNNININAQIDASSGGLELRAGTSGNGDGISNGIISSSAAAAINVKTFTLSGGTWRQITSNLPAFNVVTNFRISGGTFIRALGGDGTNANPYLISDVYGLQGIGTSGMLVNSYALLNNVDASGTATWNNLIGAGFSPIGSSTNPFVGTFDGRSYSISGLTINRPFDDYVGLFGNFNGTIQNVGLTTINIQGKGKVGGLVGYSSYGKITNSYSTGTVTGNSDVVGGLVGYNGRTIENSYSTGTVTGSIDNVGGLVGSNFGTITNSFSTGTVTGRNNVGGLVGFNDIKITNSYSAGKVAGSNVVGGLVGFNYGTITKCYYDVDTSRQTIGIGNKLGSGVIGLTSQGTGGYNSAYAKGSYSGWDISDAGGSTSVWRIYEGYTYPLLRSFLTPLTITANASKEYGDPNPTSGAATVAAGSLVNGDTLGNVSLSSVATATSSVGSYDLTPSGVSFVSGNVTNYDITYANGTLTINPRNITVMANDQSRIYGDANPVSGTVRITAGSMVNGDALALGNANLSSTAMATSGVGNYDLTPSGVSFTSGNASNYNITYANGTLTITPRNITVTANASKDYGDANPSSGAVTVASGSLVNGDTLGNASLSSIATTSSPVGSYALTPSGVSLTSGSASNYNITYTNGVLTINPRNITIMVNTGKEYGDANPSSGAVAVITGSLVNGDTLSNASLSSAATAASTVGSYALTPSGVSFTSGSASNYNITYTDGILTINPRNITVTANNQSRTYGDTNPSSGSVSLTAGNMVNGDTLGNASLNSVAMATSNVGSYALTPSGVSFTSGSASNYHITYTDGILTINPRNITVTANNQSRTYGDTNPSSGTVSLTAGNLVNSDTLGNASLSSTAMAASNVGSYALTPSGVNFTSGSASNYNITYTDGILAITPRNITVTANNQSRTYGDTNPSSGTVSLTAGNMVNSDTLGNASLSSAATATSNVGSYALTPSGVSFTSGNDSNYNIIYADGMLTVNPRNITVTANNQSRTYGDTNPSSGTVSLTAGNLVNGDTLGNASLSSIATTSSPVGSYTLTPSGVSFTRGSASNYNIAYTNGTLAITPRNIIITVNASKEYGDANPSSGAVTVTTGSLVNGDSLSNASLSSTATATSNVGSYALTQSGVSFTSGSASNYNITYADGMLTINPRNITVTVNNQSRIYGDANPASGTVSLTAGNMVNGDSLGNASLSSTATTASNVGSYALTSSGVSFTSGNAANYHITYTNGTLAINPRNITVTANDRSRIYGDANPSSGAVTVTAGSMVNGDTLGNANLSTNATATSNVGSYALTPSGVSFTSGSFSNYNITYTNGTLAITPRNITATANNQSRIYGDVNPSSGAVTVTTGSMVNGDTLGNANLSSNATEISHVGSYALTPGGVSFTSGSASNYNITYANGALTITPRNITVTANNQSRTYGDTNPSSGTVGLTAGNMVNGDSLGNASLSSTATTTSHVGNYALTSSGVSFMSGSASNYNITYANGTLTINPRNMTVTANDTTKRTGTPNPSFTATYSGLAGADTPSSLDGTLNFTTLATTASPVGSYLVTPSGLSSANYNITFYNGILTVTQPPDSYHGALITANHSGSNGSSLLGMTNSFRSNLVGGANPLLVVSDGGINLGRGQTDNL